jgi:hypothetical protein
MTGNELPLDELLDELDEVLDDELDEVLEDELEELDELDELEDELEKPVGAPPLLPQAARPSTSKPNVNLFI